MGKARSGKKQTHENMKPMIRVVGPGYNKMMTVEAFRAWEAAGGEGVPK